MPLDAMSMLKANAPQTPNGTSVNASQALGLPGLGNNLQDDLDEQMRKLKMDKQLGAGPYGAAATPMFQTAASALFGGMK